MIDLQRIRSSLKKIVIENLSLNKNFDSKINSLRIIMFHDTPKKDHDIYINQIKFLKSEGWKFLDPKKFIKEKISKKKFYGKNIVVTFDDGLKSNKNFANKLKLLFGIKSIFFVPYEFIKMKKIKDIKDFCENRLKLNKNNYKKINLNFNDLKNLINNGHIVGSHTLSHPNLKEIDDLKILTDEIKESKKLLNKELKKKIDIFAFTYGSLKDINKKSMDISLKNYDLVFSGIRGNNIDNNKILFRDEINSNYSNKMCLSFLNGNADFIYKNSRRKLLKMCNKII